MYTCVDCFSRVSVSSVLLAVEILREERQRESGQMSSKTILIGLSIFRFGGEKSVHGRPSWELASYDCTSQNTVTKILPRGNLCRRNAASMIELESEEWFDLQHYFLFWTRPKHSRIGSQTE